MCRYCGLCGGLMVFSEINKGDRYGKFESPVPRSSQTSLGIRDHHCCNTAARFLWIILLCLLVSGCQSLKKAVTLGAVASSVGVASAVLSPVATAVLAGTTVTATALVLDSKNKKTGGKTVDCAPTNFFDIVEALITQGSYWLLLLVGVPLFIGWFTPGPTSMKSKKSK